MIKGTMLQRLIAPHLSGPPYLLKEIEENIQKYNERKKNERNSGRHVQRKGGQTR